MYYSIHKKQRWKVSSCRCVRFPTLQDSNGNPQGSDERGCVFELFPSPPTSIELICKSSHYHTWTTTQEAALSKQGIKNGLVHGAAHTHVNGGYTIIAIAHVVRSNENRWGYGAYVLHVVVVVVVSICNRDALMHNE